MNHIASIQEQLSKKGIDALLITNEKDQRYASGFPFTDGAVLVSQKEAWLLTDSRYIEAAQAASGSFMEVRMFDQKQPLKAMAKDLLDSRSLHRVAAQDASLSHKDFMGWGKALDRELLPEEGILGSLRATKDEDELKAMVQAQRIAEQSLEELLHIIKPGMTEKQVAAELVYRSLLHGSEGNSFDPIVVAGARGSLPHGVPGDDPIQAGDFVTIDFGCLKEGYCSDMTRTFAIGSCTEEMAQVYDTVLKAQLAGIKAARAGISGREIDKASRDVIDQAGYGQYFGHSFGHSLGLDIHEAPNLSPSNDEPMPAGAVCSAEPGIYLPGRFGVRIEDVMILTESGSQLITRFPKELLVLGV